MNTKYCNGCKKELSIDCFSLRKKRDQIVARSRCKQCVKSYAKSYNKNLKESGEKSKRRKKYNENNPKYQRRSSIRTFARKLWIEPDSLLEYVESHNGKCDICDRSESEVGTLHIDHCHNSGHVRGLLCSACNLSLGKFEDDIDRLQQAIKYLKQDPVVKKQDKPIAYDPSWNSKQSELQEMINLGEAKVPKQGDYGFDSRAIVAVIGGPGVSKDSLTKKTCTKCDIEKDITYFVKRPRRKSGRDSICKECHNARVKKSKRKKRQ